MSDHAMLRADGFNHCIIGVCERYGQLPFLVYDQNKVVETLMSGEDGMEQSEALEWMHSQMMEAGWGSGTPGFVDTNWIDEYGDLEND